MFNMRLLETRVEIGMYPLSIVDLTHTAGLEEKQAESEVVVCGGRAPGSRLRSATRGSRPSARAHASTGPPPPCPRPRLLGPQAWQAATAATICTSRAT